jgi:hypothetical protein
MLMGNGDSSDHICVIELLYFRKIIRGSNPGQNIGYAGRLSFSPQSVEATSEIGSRERKYWPSRSLPANH